MGSRGRSHTVPALLREGTPTYTRVTARSDTQARQVSARGHIHSLTHTHTPRLLLEVTDPDTRLVPEPRWVLGPGSGGLPRPPHLRFRQCPSGRISLSVSRVFIRKVSELTESTCNCRPGSGARPSPRWLAGLGARRTPLPCSAGAGPSPAGAVPPPRGHRQLRRDTGASPPSRGSREPWGRPARRPRPPVFRLVARGPSGSPPTSAQWDPALRALPPPCLGPGCPAWREDPGQGAAQVPLT